MKDSILRKKSASEPNSPSRNTQSKPVADQSPAAIAQRQRIELLNNSPQATVQRERMNTLQRLENEEPLQAKFVEQHSPSSAQQTSNKPNKTGLPDQLKSGVENLSGMSLDHVKVHYNSSQPAQLNAHAYAQGNEIHVAPGQERHLPHETWHVVQQAQGRVKPTVQMQGDGMTHRNPVQRVVNKIKKWGRTYWVSDLDPRQKKFSSQAKALAFERDIQSGLYSKGSGDVDLSEGEESSLPLLEEKDDNVSLDSYESSGEEDDLYSINLEDDKPKDPRLQAAIDAVDNRKRAENVVYESPTDKQARKMRGEQHPDTIRRRDNKELKKEVKRQGKEEGKDKKQIDFEYQTKKLHIDGEKGHEKAKLAFEDHEINLRNEALKAKYKEEGYFDDEYERDRELTHKEQKKKKPTDKPGQAGTALSAGGQGTYGGAFLQGGQNDGGSGGELSPISGGLGLLGGALSLHQANIDYKNAENDVQKDMLGRKRNKELIDTTRSGLTAVRRAGDVLSNTGVDTVAELVPGLGLGVGAINFTEASYSAAERESRILSSRKLKNRHAMDGANHDPLLEEAGRALRIQDKRSRNADIAKGTGSAISIAGNAVNLSGVGAIVGAPMVAAGAGIRVGTTGVMAVTEHTDAKYARKERRNFEGDEFAMNEKKVLKYNPEIGAQLLIDSARQGNKPAQDYLNVYGISAEKLSKAPDEDIIKSILDRIGAPEEQETFGNKVANLGLNARDAKRKVKKELGK